MIDVSIWTDDGCEYNAPSMNPREIKEFVQLIKEHSIWLEGEGHFTFKEAMYHPQNNCFDIVVEYKGEEK
jgi:hypothetical protein